MKISTDKAQSRTVSPKAILVLGQAPSEVDEKQLNELSIQIKHEKGMGKA